MFKWRGRYTYIIELLENWKLESDISKWGVAKIESRGS
jgi:hypothetical protein